jgi:hypothetical protein
VFHRPLWEGEQNGNPKRYVVGELCHLEVCWSRNPRNIPIGNEDTRIELRELRLDGDVICELVGTPWLKRSKLSRVTNARPSENFSMWSGWLAANFVIQVRETTGSGRKTKRKLILTADSYGRIDDLQQRDGAPNDVKRFSKCLNSWRGAQSYFLKSSSWNTQFSQDSSIERSIFNLDPNNVL